MNDQKETQLPRWKCHKVVEAFRIQVIRQSKSPKDGNRQFTLEGEGLGEFCQMTVSEEWYHRKNPEAGGYFIRYQDGYCSYSPQEVFEEGYTLLEDESEEDVQSEGFMTPTVTSPEKILSEQTPLEEESPPAEPEEPRELKGPF